MISGRWSTSDLSSVLLTPAERARATRYRRREDAARHATGRVLARCAVARLLNVRDADVLITSRPDGPTHGQPVASITAAPAVPVCCVSIAHAGDLVLAVAASVPCGIDVESEAEIARLEPSEVAFTAAEHDALATWAGTAEAARWWTSKEAVAKALGTGFLSPSADPAQLDCSGEEVWAAGICWRLTEVPVPTGYCATLALPARDTVQIVFRACASLSP